MSAREGDERRFWRILLAIALVALVLRVSYVAFGKTNQPIRGDQLFYNAEANRLARGDGFLVALALFYVYRLIREPNLWNALLVGALCGLAAMTRAELILLIPLLAVPRSSLG